MSICIFNHLDIQIVIIICTFTTIQCQSVKWLILYPFISILRILFDEMYQPKMDSTISRLAI